MKLLLCQSRKVLVLFCWLTCYLLVSAKKTSLADVGIVGQLCDEFDEKETALPTSAYMGRAMGIGSGLGRSTFSASTTGTGAHVKNSNLSQDQFGSFKWFIDLFSFYYFYSFYWLDLLLRVLITLWAPHYNNYYSIVVSKATEREKKLLIFQVNKKSSQLTCLNFFSSI